MKNDGETLVTAIAADGESVMKKAVKWQR